MAIALGLSVGFIIIGYLLGSFPTGYLVGLSQGLDIRQHGSGGTGATNVLRTLGKSFAIGVLLVDILKGAAAIALGQLSATWISTQVPATVDWFNWLPWVLTGMGLAAILGHSRSIWINFTGGKSAATGLGVIFTMAWPVGVGILLTFVLTLLITRIVSLGSILAAIATAVLMVMFHQPLPYQLLGLAGGLYVIVRHRTNIQRMGAGQEPKIGQKLSADSRSGQQPSL